MRPICGITAVEKRGKLGREGKVGMDIYDSLFLLYALH